LATDSETARLKSLLEKSRNEHDAVLKQLEQMKCDLDKLAADKQTVSFCFMF